MKVIKEKLDDWNKCVEVNSKDSYSNGVITYLKRWADLMELEIDSGKKLIDIADKASHDADTEGITGFMYGCAVSILSQVWVHGEELRKWHNKEFGYEGEGCVNPAILTVEV